MLVLSRKEGERIVINDEITITVVRVRGNKVRLGVEAPANVLVLRGELEKLEQPPVAPRQRPERAAKPATGRKRRKR